MGSISIWHWLIVLLVVVLIFGTKKLRSVGSDLGGAVKGFKEGVRPDDDSIRQPNMGSHIIEGEVSNKTRSNA